MCKYQGSQNGVTVSVVSNCHSVGGGSSSGSSSGITSSTVDSGESASVDENAEGDSDGEVSRIDFRGVNLRTKKKRDASGRDDENDVVHQQPERPMSWEGELSDQEMSSNTITQVGFYTDS